MIRRPRMVISDEGLEGSGKSDFALRGTPRPLTYLDFDNGAEGIAPDVPDLWDGVTRHAYDLSMPLGASDTEVQKRTLAVMKEFLAHFRAAVGTARTLVVDTFTAAWAGQRIARSEEKYVVYEEEFRSLVKSVYDTDTNLILIHHLKPDWKRDSSGKSYKGNTYSRDGMDNVLSLVQLGIRHRYVQPVAKPPEPGRFEIDVLKCRDQMSLMGVTMPAMDWQTLCTMVCPSVDWSV